MTALPATLLMPGYRLERTKADNVVRTSRGYRVSLGTRFVRSTLLSTVTMLRLRGAGVSIVSVRVAASPAGLISAPASVRTSQPAASLRFFAGGDNSVRGYAYESLGPLDASGLPEGGRNLLVGGIEYEHPVVKDEWWVAAFVDVAAMPSTARNSSHVTVTVWASGGIRRSAGCGSILPYR